MPEFTAKDVKALRDATGAGMMDAKKALVENDGDFEAAKKWLREKGLGKAAARDDRENAEGAIAVVTGPNAGAFVQLKSETDFVAKSDGFMQAVQRLAEAVLAEGEDAVAAQKDVVDDLRLTLKENIAVGQVARLEAGEGQVLDAYLHRQDGRGVNAVLVLLQGGTPELAHDLAVHIAFTKPTYLSRDDVPADAVAEERATLERMTRAEGKPEAALEKIVSGRLNGFFKERVLLEQSFVRDEKQTIKQLLGSATIVQFAQAFIGA
jgi:elongation factor Ts